MAKPEKKQNVKGVVFIDLKWIQHPHNPFIAQNPNIAALSITISRLKNEEIAKTLKIDPVLLKQAEDLLVTLTQRAMEATKKGYKRDVVKMNNIAWEINNCLKKAEKNELTRHDVMHLGEVALPHKASKKEKLARLLPANKWARIAKESGQHLRLSKSEGIITKTGVVDSDPDALFTINSKIDTDVFAFMEQADKNTPLKKKMHKEKYLTTRIDIIKKKGIAGISWQGGGVKGLATLGVIEELEKAAVLQGSIANVGSSVGSIQATAFSLGARTAEMTKLMSLNLKELVKDYKDGDIENGMDKLQVKIEKLLKEGKDCSKEQAELKKLSTLFQLRSQRKIELKKQSTKNGSQNTRPTSKRAAFLKKVAKSPGEKLYLECKYIVLNQLQTLLTNQIGHLDNNAYQALILKISEKEGFSPEEKELLKKSFQEIWNAFKANKLVEFKLSFRHHKALQIIFPEHVGDLAITGTNLVENKLEYYDYKNSPDMEVARAMRISAGLPPIFAPFENQHNQLSCDGGLTSNAPADYLVKKLEKNNGIILSLNYENKHFYTPESAAQKTSLRDKTSFRDVIAYVLAGIARFTYRNERESVVAAAIAEGKVLPLNIPHGNVRSDDFDISPTRQETLIKNAKTSTSRWLYGSTSRYTLEVQVLHDKLLKMSGSGEGYQSIDYAEFKTPGNQQTLLAYIKQHAADCVTKEEKLEYLEKVKASPLYDILQSSYTSSFLAPACKQQFEHLLVDAEKACGINRTNLSEIRAQSTPYMTGRS